MTRTTPYRVHTCSAPMAGKAPIEPMPGVSVWRANFWPMARLALLIAVGGFALALLGRGFGVS